MGSHLQNKKRKYDREGDDRGDRERTPEEPAEDPLKDATTLYVGNLYVPLSFILQSVPEADHGKC